MVNNMFEDLTYNKKEKKPNKSFYELYNMLDALKILLNLNKCLRESRTIYDTYLANLAYLIKINAGMRCGKTTLVYNFAKENIDKNIAYISGHHNPTLKVYPNIYHIVDVDSFMYLSKEFDYIFMEYPSKGQVDKLLKGLKNVPYIIIMD